MQHPGFPRIHIDGFAGGPVTEDIYSDIVGADGIALEKARDFEETVVEIIDQIYITQVGRVLLEHINSAGNNYGIRIIPHGLSPLVESDYIAFGNRTNAYSTSYAPSRSSSRGTGQGTSTTIYFVPDGTQTSNCRVIGSPEIILFHELIHALRGLTGSYTNVPFPVYDNFEEFVAITLTNMYRSEQSRTVRLRGGHDCQTMPYTIDDFKQLYHRYLSRIIQGGYGNQSLFRSLARLRIPWNPLSS